ncbi:MAG: nuclear transport factor 2 family protein [Ramlibacter sp.]
MRPEETLQSLYAAFARLDAAAMAACYVDDAMFDDEVFSLHGRREVAGMWTMLCEAARAQGDGWRLVVEGVQARDGVGRAHWQAWYRFGDTGRPVHNCAEASFTFASDGRIARHRDRFAFWRWSRQALGLPGVLLGWSPMLRDKVRVQAAANLRRHLARTSADAPARAARG